MGLISLPPRIVVAAPQGRSGKTIVTMGICAALRGQGLTVQAFKKGPDYIDPSWLTAVTGRPCRNLDAFFMSPDMVIDTFQRASSDADIAVVEGAMGLYDGVHISGEGSTAQLAKLLRAPVILVINAARMTYSAGAMVMGYRYFDPDVSIAGVILNNVAGSRHERKLREAIEGHCGIPVLGAVPKDPQAAIAERHLGLIPFGENADRVAFLDPVKARIVSHLDIEKIMAIAREAPDYPVPLRERVSEDPGDRVKIGIFQDRVFSFYYPENLEALSGAGAELVSVNSLKDNTLPDVDGLYIGGGFPELFAPELEANRGLREGVARAVEDGLPVYAECAGLMYLSRRIRWQGEWYEMAGVIPADVEMCAKPQGHGYVEMEVCAENPFFSSGSILRGHEFHHSRFVWSKEPAFAFRVIRGQGVNGRDDGIIYKNIFAAYTHLHAAAAPEWAKAFVDLVAKEKRRNPAISAPGPAGKNTMKNLKGL